MLSSPGVVGTYDAISSTKVWPGVEHVPDVFRCPTFLWSVLVAQGREALIDNTLDFAVSDVPPSQLELSTSGDLVALPFAAQVTSRSGLLPAHLSAACSRYF